MYSCTVMLLSVSSVHCRPNRILMPTSSHALSVTDSRLIVAISGSLPFFGSVHQWWWSVGWFESIECTQYRGALFASIGYAVPSLDHGTKIIVFLVTNWLETAAHFALCSCCCRTSSSSC